MTSFNLTFKSKGKIRPRVWNAAVHGGAQANHFGHFNHQAESLPDGAFESDQYQFSRQPGYPDQPH